MCLCAALGDADLGLDAARPEAGCHTVAFVIRAVLAPYLDANGSMKRDRLIVKGCDPRWLHNRITSAMREVARVRRELRKARRLKDAMCLARELKKAQIECAYEQHWVMLT
jgi:hypothetical protein